MSEVKERQERLAKMRTMLSYHEAKAKRMKKIKSKAFHRLLQKDRKGKAGVEDEFDAEALKEAAIKAEFKRAQVPLQRQVFIFSLTCSSYMKYTFHK